MRCEATTTTGKSCGAPAQKGRRVCFHHDPDQQAKRHEARVRGGRKGMTRVLPDWEIGPIETGADVKRLMGECLRRVLTGEIDPRVANAAGYLAGAFIKADEHGAVLESVERIERVIANRRAVLLSATS